MAIPTVVIEVPGLQGPPGIQGPQGIQASIGSVAHSFPVASGTYLPVNSVGSHGNTTLGTTVQNSYQSCYPTPIVAALDTLVDAVGLYVSTAGDNSATVEGALYDEVGGLVTLLPDIPVDSTGLKTVLFDSPFTLPAGRYIILLHLKDYASTVNPAFYSLSGAFGLSSGTNMSSNNTGQWPTWYWPTFAALGGYPAQLPNPSVAGSLAHLPSVVRVSLRRA